MFLVVLVLVWKKNFPKRKGNIYSTCKILYKDNIRTITKPPTSEGSNIKGNTKNHKIKSYFVLYFYHRCLQCTLYCTVYNDFQGWIRIFCTSVHSLAEQGWRFAPVYTQTDRTGLTLFHQCTQLDRTGFSFFHQYIQLDRRGLTFLHKCTLYGRTGLSFLH